MGIPFIDLKKQFQFLEKDIKAAVNDVLESGQYIMGPQVRELEAALADYVGVDHAVGCSSGTDALLIPLMAKGIGPGDAVFTTTFTFIATAEVISLLGAEPVFVDIDEKTFNIDPAKLEEAVIRVKTEGRLTPKAIIPVDMFGLPADYDPITKIGQDHDLFILEDAAQGFGGVYHNKRAGSFGDAAGTSFFPAKSLGCYGDGGAIFTNDEELVDAMRSVRVHGQGGNKYENVRVGLNGRLDTIQAAVLLVKLAAFPRELEQRRKVAKRYNDVLKTAVETPVEPDGYKSGWSYYSVLSDERETIQERLKAAGVPTVVYYPIPLHLQKAFAHLNYKEGDFPVSEDISTRIFSLPMHPYLADEQIDAIADKF